MVVKIRRDNMGKSFLKIDASFFSHDKTIFLMEEYPDIADSIIRALWWLWERCRDRYQDGVLRKNARTIERMVLWKGEGGKFVEIITGDDARFLDYISEEEYRVHNWFKNQPHLDTEKQEEISKQNAKNAHAKYIREEQALLEKNWVNIADCDWLYLNGDGRLSVKYKRLPNFMELEDETFYKQSGFRETNRNSTKRDKGTRLGLIKEGTKPCKRCKQYFVSTISDECVDCRGR
jgi:hypothetical protein